MSNYVSYEQRLEYQNKYNALMVTVSGSDNSYSADKSHTEIINEYRKGRKIYALYGNIVVPMVFLDTKIYFYDTSKDDKIFISIDNDDSVSVTLVDNNVLFDLDDTLSVSGAAADAKATSDAISDAIEELSRTFGAPLTASTVAEMTNEERAYVYTGSEDGYTAGNWYYYDGSDWVSGGVYNAIAVQTDTTLTVSGGVADAKKTGDEITDLKSALIQELDSGTRTFKYYAVFENYGITTSGAYANQRYRVSTIERMSFDIDITVSVASGFRWGYIPYANGAYGSWSGWKTDDYTISAGTSFIVQIARTTENTSEIADVDTFLNAVVFNTATKEGLHALEVEVVDLQSAVVQSYNLAKGNTNLLTVLDDSVTKNHITFTASSDGTVTATGTASANAIYAIEFKTIKSGTYILSGCPSGGSASNYYQRINSITGNDVGNGVEVALTAGVEYYVWIVIGNGKTVSGLTFTPTLQLVGNNITDNTTAITASPCKAQTPPLFEGGIDPSTGKYHHDTNETWMKTRIRTNVVYVASGAVITTSGSYNITVCRYANYDLSSYIETLESETGTTSWTCPANGYYTITFKDTNIGDLTIDTVKSAWDFSKFYCMRDERIHVHWIGSGNESETSTHTDSGDCALVVFPDGTGLLIDSANSRNYTSVRKRLAEAGFYRIKNIIISHFHSDHIGGLITLVNYENIDISGATVYLPDYDATLWAYNNNVMEEITKTLYDSAMTMFNDNNCTLVYPDTDFEPYEIGGAVLAFYNTDLSVYEGVSTNYNDWSLCNYIIYGNMNINFSGDVGPIAQAQLGGSVYKTNIYKADHHGWLNQTTIPSAYIRNISPDVIIALDGSVHDTYLGTDTAPLILWAEDNGVPYYRKYTNGEIVMAVSKDSWCFVSKVSRYYTS